MITQTLASCNANNVSYDYTSLGLTQVVTEHFLYNSREHDIGWE